ncbi:TRANSCRIPTION FACTOR SCREAM2-RELATED [Salix purpurea]|uniref:TRANSCRIPTION FACTOR SCREAM2-RELATED n=1 Tax=Salix purpurea TaxID=77065 RepID=A0A9Q0WN76_SALPP|nr:TRANSCRIPTION FACTOR SCREAM2-RELATED [Salix purpurea]
MVVRLERRAAMHDKRHHLRTLTCSKSVKRKNVTMDDLLCIYKLKLKLEAVKRELSNLIAIKRELQLPKVSSPSLPPCGVEVEKGEKGFLVRVICEKGGDKLVSILEVFEEMGLTVSHARVSCNLYLSMEAIVVAEEECALHVKSIAQAITKAIERQ